MDFAAIWENFVPPLVVKLRWWWAADGLAHM